MKIYEHASFLVSKIYILKKQYIYYKWNDMINPIVNFYIIDLLT